MDLRRALLGQLGGPHGVLAPLVARILNRSNAGQNRGGVTGFRDDEHRVERPDDIAGRALEAGFASAHTQGVGDPKRSVLVIATT